MNMLRRFLIYVRQERARKGWKFFAMWGALAVLAIGTGVVLDVFTPFGGWWNFLRAVVMIPLTVSLFAVLYGVAVKVGALMLQSDQDWVPFRLRFGPKTRRNYAIVLSAFLVLMVLTLRPSPVYTLVASLVVVFALLILSFTRKTLEEEKREAIGALDPRDDVIERRVADIRRARVDKKTEKESRKKKATESESTEK